MDDKQFLADLQARFNAGEKLKYVFFWGHRPAKALGRYLRETGSKVLVEASPVDRIWGIDPVTS